MNQRMVTLSVLLSVVGWHSAAHGRDLYVAPGGDDASPGTLSAPFRTLGRAAGAAVAGDTVHIRAGTYEETLRPANSGTAANPIVFQSYGDEKVTISAMQALDGWTHDGGAVYRTSVDWSMGQQNFVMHGDTVLDLARWPNNVDGDLFTQDTLRNTGGSSGGVINGAYLDYGPGIPNVDWADGGSIYFYGDKPGAGWIAWRAFVTSSTSTRVVFELDKNPTWIRTFHAPADGGEFFLQGVRGALDYANEWYLDADSNTLFVQLPGGGAPTAGAVKMRRRSQTIDLRDRHYIQIRNLAVFGGSIELTGSASHNELFGLSSFYGNHSLGVNRGFLAGSQSVHVEGSDNVIDRCEIGFGAGTGVLDGGTRNRLTNSYVHDFNYLGSYDAAVMLRGGGSSTVTHNRISRAGRDAVQSVHDHSEFAYNDVSWSNLIVDDCALFYTLGGPRDMEVHHNWFHDAYSTGGKTKAAGIYLDNDSEGFDVHHNVVWNTEWTNIQINWDGKDLSIFNNTLVDGSKVMGAWHKPGTAFSNVKVWNNLSNDNHWEPQSDKRNNVSYTIDPFVAKATGDFRIRAGTAPIDAGRVISGVTDGYVGAAPDVGAYELGATAWVPGIDWDPNLGPTGRGCYGLPGETCSDSPPTPEPPPEPPAPGPITPPAEARLRIRHSDRCVDVAGTGDGANVQQWSCHSGANQRFSFTHRGGGFYEVVDRRSGKCLDVAGVATGDAATLNLWACHGGANQRFQFVPATGDWFELRAQHSDRCADVSGVSTEDGGDLIQWACHDGHNQQFRFD